MTTAPVGCLDGEQIAAGRVRMTLVAEIMRYVDSYAYDYKAEGKLAKSRRGVENAILTALSASRQEGWQLVPVEPTLEMIDAAMHVKRVRLLEVVAQIRAGMDEAEARTPAVIAEWQAMLAAAPHQSQEAQGDRHGE